MAEPHQQQDRVQTAGEIVLVVEDNPAVRDVVHRQLTRLGYKVVTAENAANALAVLESGAKVDLVFSDVVMPGSLSGVDLADIVATRWPAIKIVLTSGYSDVDARGYLVLSKPYRQAALVQRIRETLAA